MDSLEREKLEISNRRLQEVQSRWLQIITLLGPENQNAIANALKIAAEIYHNDAEICGIESRTGQPFLKQEKEALELMERLEL